MSIGVDFDKPFNFKDYPELQDQYNKITKQFISNVDTTAVNAVSSEWYQAERDQDEFVNDVMTSYGAHATDYPQYFNHARKAAVSSYINRKDKKGLRLSDKIWKLTNSNTKQIESAISVALEDGKSAQQLSRDVREYLNYPDKLFRRVRDKKGNLHLSQAAKAFHPGPGMYRSSYKNAMRLARTEINMSYREAEQTRWEQLDFVVGYEIKRSKVEFGCSVCGDLKGKYPKDFKFRGWHP